jgi:hypothetical protein
MPTASQSGASPEALFGFFFIGQPVFHGIPSPLPRLQFWAIGAPKQEGPAERVLGAPTVADFGELQGAGSRAAGGSGVRCAIRGGAQLSTMAMPHASHHALVCAANPASRGSIGASVQVDA